MILSEVLEQAMDNDMKDLEALIMFLVYEKQVLTLEDNVRELDLYFMAKHKKRMNRELTAYKKKMGFEYGMRVYKFIQDDHNFLYVYAKSLDQAKFLALGYNYNTIKICDLDKVMHNGLTLKEITRDKKPQVLGGM